jgi:hypothetical protein
MTQKIVWAQLKKAQTPKSREARWSPERLEALRRSAKLRRPGACDCNCACY